MRTSPLINQDTLSCPKDVRNRRVPLYHFSSIVQFIYIHVYECTHSNHYLGNNLIKYFTTSGGPSCNTIDRRCCCGTESVSIHPLLMENLSYMGATYIASQLVHENGQLSVVKTEALQSISVCGARI